MTAHHGFARLRAIWPDHNGLPRAKFLPCDEERLASGRGSTFVVSTFGLALDRTIVHAPGTHVDDGLRDMNSTFQRGDVRQCWLDDRTGTVVCDLHIDGQLLAIAPRTALRRAIADWEALGLHPVVGIELEGYLLRPDAAGGWERDAMPGSFVYGTGPASDPLGLMDRVWWAAERAGITIGALNAEFDAGQFEFTLQHTDALRAADDALLCRLMVRELAQQCGRDFTFLGKPFGGVSGSGLHVNFSLLDAEGRNVLADESAADGLSDVAHRAIAGLCRHHRALVGITAPTVNAYRRLQPGTLAGYWGNWGYDHRLATTRVPTPRGAATRLESRVPDGAANVHLAIAAVLQAARLGVAEALSCPEPLRGDGYDDGGTPVHAASDLAAALDDLAADTTFMTAVGAELVANYIGNKRDEWQRFSEAVEGLTDLSPDADMTAWERSQYLAFH